MADSGRANGEKVEIPDYLRHWPGLFMRQDGNIIDALPADIAVAKSYPSVTEKGVVVAGRRITILSSKHDYRVGEEVRVIHVLEVTVPGQDIFIMGPKPVRGEFVDGRLVTAADDGEDYGYDGRVLKSPGVDYNYDITTYRFHTPGRHEIVWQLRELRSNTLHLEIR
jgi:hypothetical protein